MARSANGAQSPVSRSLAGYPAAGRAPRPSRGSNEAHNGKAGTMTNSLGWDGVGRMLRVKRGRALALALAVGAMLSGALAITGDAGEVRARRPDVPDPRRLHDRAGRRAAAGRSADRRRLRRAGAALRRRLVRLERQGRRSSSPNKPHRIVRLEDTRRRRPVRQADRLRRQDDVPRGGDVVRRLALRRRAAEHLEADRHRRRRRGRPARVEWFQGKTLTGCANDLHGPYLGPDGWIYWCKGAFAEQTYERPGQAAVRHPGRRTSSAAGPTARASSR